MVKGYCDDDKQCQPEKNFVCQPPGDMIYKLVNTLREIIALIWKLSLKIIYFL